MNCALGPLLQVDVIHSSAHLSGKSRTRDAGYSSDSQAFWPCIRRDHGHQPVTEIIGLFRREHFAGCVSTLAGSLVPVRQAQLAGNADTVGIRHHHARLMMGIAQDQIGGLSPHAEELQRSSMLSGTFPPCSSSIIRAAPTVSHEPWPGKKPNGMDMGLTSLMSASARDSRVGKRAKRGGRHHIHTLVGTLGRQTDGKEQFIGFGIVRSRSVHCRDFFSSAMMENIRFCFHSDSPRLSEI